MEGYLDSPQSAGHILGFPGAEDIPSVRLIWVRAVVLSLPDTAAALQYSSSCCGDFITGTLLLL